MKTYKVNIIETLQLEVEVEAESSIDAKSLVEGEYNNNKYTLDSSNRKQVNFVTRSSERGRSYGR